MNPTSKLMRPQILRRSKMVPESTQFCSYTHRVCMQMRLEGYDYCSRHILEDKNSPFKQCQYVSSKTSKRCTSAALRNDKKEGYCMDHGRRASQLRFRAGRKRRPKETPELLLEELEHYAPKTSNSNGADSKKARPTESLSAKVIEYMSSSDSEVEALTVEQTWRGDGDSDAESVDSEQEDPLKHASVYTAEEVALITRDKLIRLQSLYIDQFKRLQHVMKEKRRRYLHTVSKERELLGSIRYAKEDPKQRSKYDELVAMKRYHKRYGQEALLHRQSKERRIAVSEGINYKPPAHPKCIVSCMGGKCGSRTVPLSKYCLQHMLSDPHQVLYSECKFADQCKRPVVGPSDKTSCTFHAQPTLIDYRLPKKEEKDESKDEIDVVGDSKPEEPHQSLQLQLQLKQDQMKQDLTRQDKMKQDLTRQDQMKQDLTRQDQLKQDLTRQDQMKQDLTGQDQLKLDLTNQDQSKLDLIKHDPLMKQDMARQDQLKPDLTKQEQLKLDLIKPDPLMKPDLTKLDLPKQCQIKPDLEQGPSGGTSTVHSPQELGTSFTSQTSTKEPKPITSAKLGPTDNSNIQSGQLNSITSASPSTSGLSSEPRSKQIGLLQVVTDQNMIFASDSSPVLESQKIILTTSKSPENVCSVPSNKQVALGVAGQRRPSQDKTPVTIACRRVSRDIAGGLPSPSSTVRELPVKLSPNEVPQVVSDLLEMEQQLHVVKQSQLLKRHEFVLTPREGVQSSNPNVVELKVSTAQGIPKLGIPTSGISTSGIPIPGIPISGIPTIVQEKTHRSSPMIEGLKARLPSSNMSNTDDQAKAGNADSTKPGGSGDAQTIDLTLIDSDERTDEKPMDTS